LPNIHFSVVVFLAVLGSGLIILSGLLGAQLSGGSWLDYALTASQAEDFLYSYTARDIILHRWVETHVAVLMPIVLAGFAIAVIHHVAEEPRKWSLLVAMAAWGAVADYAENVVIVSLLDGGEAFRLKAALTMVKMVLVLPPQVVAVYLFLREAKVRISTA
jgi:hypothetical protein